MPSKQAILAGVLGAAALMLLIKYGPKQIGDVLR